MDATTITATAITGRDRALLRAVAAGRCEYAAGTLLADGIGCCDQFAGPRLARTGLIACQSGPARLPYDGRALPTGA